MTTKTCITKNIAFLGAGHIAEALIHSLTSSGVARADRIAASDVNASRLEVLSDRYGVGMGKDNRSAVEGADLIFVCVRSEQVPGLVEELADQDFTGKVLVNISSGIPMALYGRLRGVSVARALPNPPSKIGHGVIAVAFAPGMSPEDRGTVMACFAPMGECVELPEDKIDVITSVTGPAPVFAFCEAAIEASVLLGIDYASSSRIVFHTLLGCLKMWEPDLEAMGRLLSQASTPGGISVEQLFTLDKGGFKAAVKQSYVDGWAKTHATGEALRATLAKPRA